MKVWSGTGETLLCTVDRKETHISQKMKLKVCREGVGGVHNTSDVADNKTVTREGTLLYSSD